ncbi:hypothetical protein DACRYDRAFT_21729 [Dacryopinax primogenitus]|uniref:Uncharacterized protein n=1 Tax=Dacryopinax primogenitus (strain DJM 731) TaxID=1858805 RepID=M5GDX0_DACPD|nr:uncharacterized protein DACRYDRAFT_21729 [Dacryopinax primogenitus]EJU02763.1 hypothetical protein DACRYDRAFT_21729 [Dacryopinax primogenitus]
MTRENLPVLGVSDERNFVFNHSWGKEMLWNDLVSPHQAHIACWLFGRHHDTELEQDTERFPTPVEFGDTALQLDCRSQGAGKHSSRSSKCGSFDVRKTQQISLVCSDDHPTLHHRAPCRVLPGKRDEPCSQYRLAAITA